jgi:hypothetical protein
MEILNHFTGVTKTPNGWQAICPAHDDSTASLSISKGDDGRALLYCHAKCSTESVVRAAGLEMKDLMPADINTYVPQKQRERFIPDGRTYDYHDERGELLFQVCRGTRGGKKSFSQRTPDGNGGWLPKGPDKCVLYRLPDLLANVKELVFVVEGEKDAENAKTAGLVATTSPGGAGKWRPHYAESLRNQRVVIIPDNDKPGEDHAHDVARSLMGKAASVKILRLEGLPPKGDLSDWLAAGGTAEKLLELAAECPEHLPTVNVDEVTNSVTWLPMLSNAERVGEGQDQETIPKSLAEILVNVDKVTGGWPRRVGATLFVDDPAHGLGHFTKIDQLFGWLSSKAAVSWYKSTGCVGRGEVFSELQRTAQAYRAIEAFPHFPPFADHYYAHRKIEFGSGDYLRQLLDRFCPETPIDRDLILAMFASAVWGGDGGSRPAFVVASDAGRGVGKTTLVESLGQLVGGMFAISRDDRAGDIAKRLLTPEAATKRVVGFDNVKQNKLSWGELEAFITAREISGHQMYSGERTRPNTMLWTITLNGPALSKDMAQRSVIIKLAKPKHTGDWEDSLRDFIEAHRWQILGDLAAFLNGPAAPLGEHTRWGKWERDILARLPEPTEAQRVIAERQSSVDVDDEEAALLEDAFRQELERLGYDPDTEAVHIPNAIARDWYVKATGIQTSATGVSRAINQAATEGTLHGLKVNPSRTHGRGLLWSVGRYTAVANDIEQRIREQAWKG